MKHIVFVIGNYKNGGVPMRSTNLANEFAKAGYRCTLLATKGVAENVFFTRHENVELLSLDDFVSEHSEEAKVKELKKKRSRKLNLFKNLRRFIRFIPSLDRKAACIIKEIRRSERLAVYMALNPSSIYIPFGISYYEQAFGASYSLGCKIIYAERNAPELEFPKNKTERERLLKIVSKADAAVLQTENELEFFEGRLKNATVIHNPVKSNLPEPYCGERRKVVVNFCRVAHQKNLSLLIDAFMEFRKNCPDYKLEIYGNTVEKNEEAILGELKEYVKVLNAEEYICFLPPRGDIHSVVRDCAMFVSSSDFEGLSNSMIEAMAIGLPCVCTDCLGGGAREMITDGENGLLVPIKYTAALAHAMIRMVRDKELSDKCSKNAAKIRTVLSAESVAAEWLKTIDNIG